MFRRRFLHLAAAAPLLPLALAGQQNDPVLRGALERAWSDWRLAMSGRDVKRWSAATSKYRQMCLRNEIVSLRMPWPGALFNLIFSAPDTTPLKFMDASAAGDTARLVYFGPVDMGLEYGAVRPDNPLVIHFLKEDGAWRFNTLQYVNLNFDEELKKEVSTGGRRWLDGAEFRLTGQYPPLPKPCPEPYQVAMARITAQNCTVKVSINAGQWEESVENNAANRVIIGGLRKGGNPVSITVTPGVTGKPAAAVSFLTKNGQKLAPLEQWKLPEGELKPVHALTLWVKSTVTIR